MELIRNRHCKMALSRLAMFICAVMTAVAILPYAVSADTDPQVVRVGYYENEVFQEGAQEGVVKSGYAYEYYRKLSEYT